MRILENKNVNFNARNPKIRFADNIARKVNKEFPRISPSKLDTFNNASKYEESENGWNLYNPVKEYERQGLVNLDTTPTEGSENAVMSGGVQNYVEEYVSANAMPASSVINTFWKGTQEEYDAIEVKDDATLYIIRDEEV